VLQGFESRKKLYEKSSLETTKKLRDNENPFKISSRKPKTAFLTIINSPSVQSEEKLSSAKTFRQFQFQCRYLFAANFLNSYRFRNYVSARRAT
jgi:hypothetical protein